MHTAGPWEHYVDELEDTDSYGLLVLSEAKDVVCALYEHKGSHFERFENDGSNARLIAAAPDMLAALERIAEAATSQRRLAINLNAIEHIARQAIAKATGAA